MADVRVTVKGPVEQTMITGPDGQFSFDTLPPGDYRISAEQAGQKIVTRIPHATTLEGPHACSVFDILASSATSIAGVVTYDDGTAVAGVPVELVAAEARPTDAFLGIGATTDEHGRYELLNVPLGRYRVGVGAITGPSREQPFALAYGRSEQGEVVIAVSEEGESVRVAPIVTRRLAPARIEGKVRWMDDTPARGLLVTAAALGEHGPVRGRAHEQIAEDGRFTLNVFAGTQYRVTFSRGRRIVHSADVAATGDPIVIRLPVP